MDESFRLWLRGKTAVFIDWANVYGWETSLKKEISPIKIFRYLKAYKEIKHIYFYFGTDKHPKSKAFLARIKRFGYTVITKPVKYILVAEVKGQRVYKRKCDFDMEIALDVHRLLKEDTKSFIFLSGDGDFAPLYKFLIKENKQVIVIYVRGHLGREVWEMRRGIFKVELPRLVS